jgi:hypothetical protein
MSYGKGGGQGQTGNGGSTSDTSQYGMNNNQYNQAYPTTSVPQPVTSKYFGHPGAPGQAGTGLQFNSPADQPQPGPVDQGMPGGNWGKGGGNQPVGKPGIGAAGPAPGNQSDTGIYNQHDTGPKGLGHAAQPRTMELQAPMTMESRSAQPFNFGAVESPNFQNANPQAPSDDLQQQSYNQMSNMLFNPQPTIGRYIAPSDIATAQLSQPGVYSRAQRYSDISY